MINSCQGYDQSWNSQYGENKCDLSRICDVDMVHAPIDIHGNQAHLLNPGVHINSDWQGLGS